VESIRGFRPSYESMLEVMTEPMKAFYPIAEGKLPFYFLYPHMTEDIKFKSFLSDEVIEGRDAVYRYLFKGSPRSDGEYLRCGFGGKVYLTKYTPAQEAVIVDDSAYGEPVLVVPRFNYMKEGKLDWVKVVKAKDYHFIPSRRFKPYYDEWKMKKEADG
jgi:hypothetical protein